MSKMLDKDRYPGPAGWGLGPWLQSNLVKTQLSGNPGSGKSWLEKWSGGRRRNRRIFSSSVQKEANEYAII